MRGEGNTKDLERINMMFDYVDKQGEQVKERVRQMAKERIEDLRAEDAQIDGTQREDTRVGDTWTGEPRMEPTQRTGSGGSGQTGSGDSGQVGADRKGTRRSSGGRGKRPVFRRNRWLVGVAASLAVVCLGLGFGVLMNMPYGKSDNSAGYMPEMDSSQRSMLMVAPENGDYNTTADMAGQGWMDPQAPYGQAGSIDESLGKKIVYTAVATLRVTDVADAMRDIETRTAALGGYIVQSSYVENDSRASISIKVPQGKFAEFRDGLASWGTVLELRQSSDDIGLQYYDMEARLRTMEAQEKRYLEILQEARTVEEILRVEKVLNDVRTTIESYKGQLRYWDNQVDYAQVTLTLRQTSQDLTVKDPWEPTSFSRTLTACRNAVLKTVSTVWNLLNYLLVLIAYLLPVLVIGGLGFLVYRVVRKNRKKNR